MKIITNILLATSIALGASGNETPYSRAFLTSRGMLEKMTEKNYTEVNNIDFDFRRIAQDTHYEAVPGMKPLKLALDDIQKLTHEYDKAICEYMVAAGRIGMLNLCAYASNPGDRKKYSELMREFVRALDGINIFSNPFKP